MRGWNWYWSSWWDAWYRKTHVQATPQKDAAGVLPNSPVCEAAVTRSATAVTADDEKRTMAYQRTAGEAATRRATAPPSTDAARPIAATASRRRPRLHHQRHPRLSLRHLPEGPDGAIAART